MTTAVAVFGGSFNPPHVGHVMVAVYLLSVTRVDQVVVVPCFIHPFAKELAPFDHRLEMCRIAFEWIPGVTISDIERQLGGESRTLRTVQTLSSAHPDWALRLVVGSDVIPETPRWFGFPDIARTAPPLILDRPSRDTPAARRLFPDVSSSTIREAIGRGDHQAVEKLLPAGVFDHISQHGLFARRVDG